MRLTKWSNTLRWRLIWPAIALNLLAVAVTVWTSELRLRKRLFLQTQLRAEMVANSVNYAAESIRTEANLRRFIYALGAEQGVDLIIVATNRPMQVVACTDHEWTGAPLDQLPWPEATAALRTALTSGSTDKRQVVANGDFQVTLPFVLPSGMQAGIGLRPGAVLVRVDQTSDRTQLARAIWTATLWFIFQLLLINALILLLIKQRVLHPLQLIGATLVRRREGEKFARVPVVANDEIGAVAHAMNGVFDRRDKLEAEALARTNELAETNRRLSESEERFRIAVESTTDVIYDLNTSTKMILWHRDLGPELGYAPQEFPPTLEAWVQALHPDDRERTLAALEYHLVKGIPYDTEYRMVAKDGSLIYWRARGKALRDSQGKAVRMLGVMTNVTADRIAAQQMREARSEAIARADELAETNRRLSESEERFRIAAESTTEFIFDWNISTGTVSWTHDLGSLLGYSPQEFPPTVEGWAQGIHPDDRNRVLAALEQHVFQGSLYDIEYRLVAKDGSHTYWRARGNALRDSQGKPVRMIGALSNVTIERLASQQLHAAKETAEAANRAKDEFLAALSHELRTPLSPVLMLAGDMERSPDLPADLRDDFALIRHNVELEARLIDDLLDITRITRGKFHLENEVCDLHKVLEKAVETLRPNIEARGLSLHINLAAPDHQVMGDSVRLQQVFWNLLKNASKFTPSGGRILIRSWNADKLTICLSFTDTGLGITSENLERIFMAFEQVQHPGSQRLGGLGLGLSISRRLIEAHGGRIWAESAGLNQGTTIHVQLPLLADTSAKLATAQKPPETAAPVPCAPLRILLVEDHEETRVIMERLLKLRGHEVFAARDISTARQLAAENDFDLVISDIGLPDGTGYDLMSELRGKYPTLLGIALSGFGMEQDVQRSRTAGFFTHLTKPVDMRVLDRTIESMRQRAKGANGVES